eukprot:2425289-Prymnesium_polylepis.1
MQSSGVSSSRARRQTRPRASGSSTRARHAATSTSCRASTRSATTRSSSALSLAARSRFVSTSGSGSTRCAQQPNPPCGVPAAELKLS